MTHAEDLLIAKAARRATLTWKASVALSRKLKEEGADHATIEKYLSKLAAAVSGESPKE